MINQYIWQYGKRLYGLCLTLCAFPLFILMAVVILLPILVGVYVYRDASRRGMNAILWTLIAILAPSLIGFIIYLLVRGNYSNLKCPRCENPVTEQYVVCPKCGAKLRPSCPNCSMPVEHDWTVCPKCAQPLPEGQEDIVTPVRPKDKTLWKILVAIVVIPVLLILVLGISFSAVSGGGEAGRRGFGYTSGLFSDAFKLDLKAPSNQDGLYCAMTTSKKGAPSLKVTMNEKKLDVDVIDVDFNPTLYTFVSQSDYGNSVNVSGDLYIESY